MRGIVLLLSLGFFALLSFSQGRETYADLPGVRLWYKDTGGNGVPVVFLHSNTGSSQNWEHQIPPFTARLSIDRVRPAGLGEIHGAAGRATRHGCRRPSCLDEVPWHRTVSPGRHCRWRFCGLRLRAFFPEQLRSLTVANSIGGVQDEEYLALGRRLRPPQFDALPPEVRELGPSYRASNPEGERRWVELERMSRQSGATAQGFRNRMTFAMLESIKVPTLLITGDADLYAPPSLLPMFASRIKGAQSLVIPEVGHSGYWEKPEVFNRAVLDFIKKH